MTGVMRTLSTPFLRALAFGAVTLATLPALADANSTPGPAPGSPEDQTPRMGEIFYVTETPIAAEDPISNIIFLNRCAGGCTIISTNGTSDARTNMSSIPMGAVGPKAVSEFDQGDAMWDQLVACVRDVYAPYDIEVTDVDPGNAVVHHEAIVAGESGDIGWGGTGALGVGLVSGSCQALNNGISFTFANMIPSVEFMCATVAQESAHTFGMDHELECTDPMTYLEGCGRKYFRNLNAQCGEDVPRTCNCGGLQNSHLRLIDLFGFGDTPVASPVTSIASPDEGDTVVNGFTVFANAELNRGVSTVEFWLNGYKWETVEDFDFAQQGGTYQYTTPSNLPDGRIEVEVRAYNDLATAYGSTTVTVQKGELCTDAAADCLEGQACDAGACAWPPATAELGDACDYPQACLSESCEAGPSGTDVCTKACLRGTADTCPEGLECIAPEGTSAGFCFVANEGGGGCCSASGSTTGTAARIGLGLIVGLALVRPRRRRKVGASA